MVLAWMLWLAYALGTRTELWFWHGCSGYRMLLEHERNYGFGMDALLNVCSSNAHGIMVWAWMLWLAYALGTRTKSWFWHGCSGCRMLLEHERNYGFGMDALINVCCSNPHGIMVWAWMPERSPTALCCPATKHREYGHKMAFGSLASAQNPTPVSKIELLQPPQNRAVTPGWRGKTLNAQFEAAPHRYATNCSLLRRIIENIFLIIVEGLGLRV